MIPSSALDDYLTRKRADHRWIKRLTHKQLDAALAELDPPPKLCSKVLLHQKACFLLGVSYPCFSHFLDMGAGKTLLTLELLRYWRQAGEMRRALVFITSDKALPTWLNQMERFGIAVPYCAIVEGSSKEKWNALKRFKHGIIYVTYPGAVAMCSKRAHGKRGQMILDKKLVGKLAEEVDALVLDESTRAGGNSLTNLLCHELAKHAKIRYALAGRPFGRDPTLLFRQQLIIDGGESFGKTLGLFRAAFFTAEKNRWARSKYAMNYTFDKRKATKLARMMRHRSISYTADECVELPPVVVIRETVPMTSEVQDLYKRAVETAINAKGNLREMKNVFVRMRQLSSGFVGFKDDDTGDKAEVELQANPKRERLLELLEDLPEGRKALVFYEYTLSGRRISEELKKLGIGHIWLWSGTKDSTAALNKFMTKEDCTVAVVNHKIGAYSLDGLQVANYLFFYESPVSVIDREQAERRVRRKGQRHKVFQYDLVMKDTMDEKILTFHKEGTDILKKMSQDPLSVFT
jgi:SNF2 family DNA or RNA helicase